MSIQVKVQNHFMYVGYNITLKNRRIYNILIGLDGFHM